MEKEAFAGIIYDVTSQYGVPLMVSRGFASESYLYSAAETIGRGFNPNKRRTYIYYFYYFGDHDPSGLKIGESIEAELRRMCQNMTPSLFDYLFACADGFLGFLPDEKPCPSDKESRTGLPFENGMLQFVRVAVAPEQIEAMNLCRPDRRRSSAIVTRGWDPDRNSVELNAIPRKTLRVMVENCISNHVDSA